MPTKRIRQLIILTILLAALLPHPSTGRPTTPNRPSGPMSGGGAIVPVTAVNWKLNGLNNSYPVLHLTEAIRGSERMMGIRGFEPGFFIAPQRGGG